MNNWQVSSIQPIQVETDQFTNFFDTNKGKENTAFSKGRYSCCTPLFNQKRSSTDQIAKSPGDKDQRVTYTAPATERFTSSV